MPHGDRFAKGVALFAAILGLVPVTTLHGAGAGDAAKPIIVAHCVKCHAVPGYSSAGPESVQAPSFQALADSPEIYTPERLRAFLRQPHYPMQGYVLSASDVANLIAFIASLRK